MDTFEAVGDPTRRAILDLLRRGPMSAGAIADAFSISRPAISRHLRHLREAGAIEAETQGRSRVYQLVPGWQLEIQTWVLGFGRYLPESVLDAFETEVYRTRRDVRAAQTESSEGEERTA